MISMWFRTVRSSLRERCHSRRGYCSTFRNLRVDQFLLRFIFHYRQRYAILNLYRRLTLNHGEAKETSAVARSSLLKQSSLPSKSLASFDIISKYSSGKQKSHFKIFVVVSSTESSKKGERPLKLNINHEYRYGKKPVQNCFVSLSMHIA